MIVHIKIIKKHIGQRVVQWRNGNRVTNPRLKILKNNLVNSTCASLRRSPLVLQLVKKTNALLKATLSTRWEYLELTCRYVPVPHTPQGFPVICCRHQGLPSRRNVNSRLPSPVFTMHLEISLRAHRTTSSTTIVFLMKDNRYNNSTDQNISISYFSGHFVFKEFGGISSYV